MIRSCKRMLEGNWYNRVYLCWEDTNFDKPTTHNPVKGFKCYKYNSFEGADNVWQNRMTEYKNMKIRHIIIPVCKWIPQIFDEYVINRKLRKIYWLEKNTFGIGYNDNDNDTFNK